MKFQFTVDNEFGEMIQQKASELGFSVSSYLRYVLKGTLNQSKLNKIDKALLEKSETITIEQFKKEIELLKNA